MHLVKFWLVLIIWCHQILFEMVDVEVKAYRHKRIVVRTIITDPRDIFEVVL